MKKQVRTRKNGFKLINITSDSGEREKNGFTNRIVEEWNKLSKHVVGASKVDIFKKRLHTHTHTHTHSYSPKTMPSSSDGSSRHGRDLHGMYWVKYMTANLRLYLQFVPSQSCSSQPVSFQHIGAYHCLRYVKSNLDVDYTDFLKSKHIVWVQVYIKLVCDINDTELLYQLLSV